MKSSVEAKSLLETSKSLIQAGRTDEAKVILVQMLKEDPNNGRAWYAYSFVANGLDQQIDALEKTLILRPDSRRATRRIQRLMKQLDPEYQPADAEADAPTARPRTNRLAPARKRPIPPVLLITGAIVAGTFVLLLVLSVNTLIEASKPRSMPTLLPLGVVADTTTVMTNTP